MKITGSYGPKRTERTKLVALVVAGMMVAMLLAQLYGYEDFAVTLGGLLPINDAATLSVIAAIIVIVELLSLPYLLGMYVSKLMRIACGFLATSASLFWLFTSLTNAHANNSVLFSTALELPGGIFATAWSLAIFAGIVIVIKADTDSAGTTLEKKAKLE